MALDTAAKRSSAINVGSPWRSRLPLPDGTIGQNDRQAVAFMYGGILAGGAVVAPAAPAQPGGSAHSGAAGPMTWPHRRRSPFTEAENAEVYKEMERQRQRREKRKEPARVKTKSQRANPFVLDPELLALDEDLAIIEALNAQ